MTVELYIQQHLSRVKNLSSGSKAIPVNKGVWDIFHGEGWKNHSRVQIIKNTAHSAVMVSGIYLSLYDRTQLSKELTNL